MEIAVDLLIKIVSFVFVLGVLVFVHEAGHFLLARLVGAPVEVFSLGFGKRLWGFCRGDTDYRISLVPLGGYVRVPGLGPDEMAAVGEDSPAVELLPRSKRAAILVAGPLTNVIFAVLFMAAAFMLGVEVPAYLDQPPVVGWVEPESPAAGVDIQRGDVITMVDSIRIPTWRDLDMALVTSGGHQVVLTVKREGATHQVALTPERTTRYHYGYSGLVPPIEPTIGEVAPRSPAHEAKLKAGDRIVAINSNPVHHFYDLYQLISPHPDEEITLRVERGSRTLSVVIVPDNEGGDGRIGVSMALPMIFKKFPPRAAARAGAAETWRFTVETFRILRKLVTFKISVRQISGPIEIARISGDAAEAGFRKLIWFMGLISLQLGIFNLLPIPLLDGGHLTIIGFETAIRRDLSLRLKERILQVGFYFIILLFVVVTFNDIVKNIPERLYQFFTGG